MNKKELVNEVATKTEMTKKDVTSVVESTLETIKEELSNKGDVSLTGFGKFSVGHRNATKGRNPQTGEEIDVPAKDVPKFKAGKQLKEEVNQ